MRTLMLALCAGVILGACQDAREALGPPPTLSPGVKALFEDYKARRNPMVFVVSTDGQAANYSYCPDHADICPTLSGATTSKIIKSCQESSLGVPCKVYATGRWVVWK